jgi:predicted dehydrogenase
LATGAKLSAGLQREISSRGGALFDLIHQIDIALWLFGGAASVQAVLAKLSDLDIQCDDITNMLLTHVSGVTGHIQLDMASPVYRCEAEVMTSNELLRWSYAEGMLRCLSPEGETIVDVVSEGFERNDLFLTHMAHWLARMDNSSLQPLCSFEDGVAALAVALGAREADLYGQTVKL